jgi:hypothetical protein
VRETTEAKGRRYLVEARVRILHCDEEAGVIEAEVRGDCRLYSTGRDGGRLVLQLRRPDAGLLARPRTAPSDDPRAARGQPMSCSERRCDDAARA